MARTLVELQAELSKKAPRFIADNATGQLLLKALATAIRAGDVVLDGFVAALDRATASGYWLDARLDNLGLRPRDAWEDDEAVAERAIIAPDGPTPAAIVAATQAAIPTPSGHEVTLSEPRLMVVDVDLFCDVPGCILTALDGPREMVALVVPMVCPHTSSDVFVDVDFYPDFAYLDPLFVDFERNPYLRQASELDRRTPAAVAQHFVITDTVEDAHIPLIWLTTTGFIL